MVKKMSHKVLRGWNESRVSEVGDEVPIYVLEEVVLIVFLCISAL